MTDQSRQIEYFKKEAKKLFRQVKAGEAEALDRVKRVLKDSEDISLMRVQHVVAAECGFLKWEDLLRASALELSRAVKRSKNRTATPLGIFYRGTGIIPATPENEAIADMFDKMTLPEQERYLDEEARRMGFFDR